MTVDLRPLVASGCSACRKSDFPELSAGTFSHTLPDATRRR